MSEVFSRGENVACNGRVLCRRCDRVSSSQTEALDNKWTTIGIKIVEKTGSYYWGLCWECQEKLNARS
jgi:hypothetical protein